MNRLVHFIRDVLFGPRRGLVPAFLILAVAGLALLVASRHVQVLELWPSREWTVKCYSDRQAGGFSRIEADTLPGGRLRMQWLLDARSKVPYVGMIFQRRGPALDITAFDSLEVTWESDRGTALKIILMADEPGFTRSDRPLSRRYLQMECSPGIAPERRTLPLELFLTPAWWFRENRHLLDSPHRFLERLLAVSFEAGESVQPGAQDVVRVRSLRLVGHGRRSWAGGGLLLLLASAFLGILAFRAPRNPPDLPSAPSVKPQALDVPPSRSELVREWMQSHYQHPDISMEMLSREIGVGEDTASREVKKAFGEGFKQVLNRLRLAEAQRLLRDTEMGISEIAYKVGYGNVPHFNRMAKDAWGHSPSEERVVGRKGELRS